MNKAINLFFLFSVIPLVSQTAATAITLEFTPSDQTTILGNQVSVDLAISDLGAGIEPSLSAFDISVGFDSSIIAFNDAVFGEQLDLFGLGSINGADLITFSPDLNLFEISLDLPDDIHALQADSFVLATVTFDAVGLGTSNLTFNDVLLSDASGLGTLDAEFQPGLIRVEQGTTVVPESSTAPALFVLGTTGILLFRRPKK